MLPLALQMSAVTWDDEVLCCGDNADFQTGGFVEPIHKTITHVRKLS